MLVGEGKDGSDLVVVGLGNPGPQYQYNRHNAGALVVAHFAHNLGFTFKEEKRFNAKVSRGKKDAKSLHLLLPMTYMNESGKSVSAYLNYYRLKPSSLIVISDDVELPFARLRLRRGGSSGGHNGLKSIESHLSTQEYMRLRIGVGKALCRGALIDYVLDNFNREEMEQLPQLLNKAIKGLNELLTKPFEEVANKVNVPG